MFCENTDSFDNLPTRELIENAKYYCENLSELPGGIELKVTNNNYYAGYNKACYYNSNQNESTYTSMLTTFNTEFDYNGAVSSISRFFDINDLDNDITKYQSLNQ